MVVSPTLPHSSFFVRGKNLNKLIRAAYIGKKSDCVSSAFCFFLLLLCFLSFFWICFQYYSAYHSKVIYRWRKCTTVVVVAFINIIGLHEKWVFVRMGICLSMCSVVRLVEAKKLILAFYQRLSDQYQYLSDFAWWPALRSAIVTCMDKVMHTILYVFSYASSQSNNKKVDIRSFFLSLK